MKFIVTYAALSMLSYGIMFSWGLGGIKLYLLTLIGVPLGLITLIVLAITIFALFAGWEPH